MNVAQSITGWLRATGYFRIPESLDGGRLEITESIKLPSYCLLEGDGRGARIHCLGSFPAFVFLNLDGSASVGVKIRSVRETRDGDTDAGGAAYSISTSTLQATDLWLQAEAIATTYGDPGDPQSLVLGQPVAVGTAGDWITMRNPDGRAGIGDWRIGWNWWVNPPNLVSPDRHDPYLLFGYNLLRRVFSEPGFGIQMEPFVVNDASVGGDPAVQLIEYHFDYIGINGVLRRAWSSTTECAAGMSDLSFQNRRFIISNEYKNAVDQKTIGHFTWLTTPTPIAVASVSTGTSSVAFAAPHNISTGDKVTIANVGGALPAPLVAGTIYWAIVDDATHVAFAASAANVKADNPPGTRITLTTVGSGVHTVTSDRPAAGGLAVGFGTPCNANANVHTKGRTLLFESDLASATANGKKWDVVAGGVAGAGDNLAVRAVTDNYAASVPVFEVIRAGAALSGVKVTPPLELVGGLANLPVHADNAAAIAGGLAVGQLYRTATGVLMVRYAP